MNKADEVIDLLVEQVTAAYPKERLDRIKAKTTDSWYNRAKERISYVVISVDVPPEPKTPADATPIQAEMIWQLKIMLHNAKIDAEYFPAFSSGLEQVTIPSMFRCVKEGLEASDHIKPVIESPSDVYSLPEAEVREGYVCYDMLERMKYKYYRAGKKIPVYMTDIQGPFSCAAQMWGIESFLMELGDYEEEAHHLLSLCTDAIIKYFHAMYDAVEGNMVPIHCHPVMWVPLDAGVAVSDDFFAIVGAHTVRDFSVPYLERIGEHFGGVLAHTCGNMNHLAPLMNTTKHLRALNFSNSETDLLRYAAESRDDIALLVHRGGLSIGGLPLLDTEGVIAHCRDAARTYNKGVIALPMYTGEPITAENLLKWEAAARF